MVPVLFLTGCRNEEAQKLFWSAGTASDSKTVLYIALGVGFLVCELINVRMRKSVCDTRTFGATVWLSYPVCVGSPIAGMFVSRYVLVWFGMADPVYFIILSASIAIPLCILGTRLVVRYGKQHIEEISKMP
jgi:hypothetical protein